MTTMESNIVLIGMPGSGKSTVGVVLAKYARRPFIDTDILIQTKTGRSLQDIVNEDGYMALRRIEEEVIMATSFQRHVIATGGSAVYSTAAMTHLKNNGVIVFLYADSAVLASRIHDFNTRGLSKRKDQSFSDLFTERMPLYRAYADITVDCSLSSHETVAWDIMETLNLLPHT
jgi:shikimate kinase